MNVLLLTGEYPPMRGGIADYTRGLARSLRTQDIAVTVLTAAAAQPPAAADGIEVDARIQRWGWGLFHEVGAALARTGADVLHLQYQTGAFALHPAVNLLPWRLRRHGIPVVTTMHDLRTPYLFPKAGRLRAWANALLMRSSRAVIVTNAQDYHAAARQVPTDRLHVVPLANQVAPCPPPGYDRAAFRRAHSLDGRFVIAHFGMINHSKGAPALVEATVRLRSAGVPAHLLFIGEATGSTDPTNRDELARLHRLIAVSDLRAAVTFTGHLPDAEVSAWLLAADAAALPFTDGASFRRTSLLAVMAHGLPVVTTVPPPAPTLADMPELRDGEDCLLVARGPDGADAPALTERLRRLYEQPHDRQRLGDGGRRLAQRFSWGRVATAHRDIYRQVVEDQHEHR